MLQWLGWFTACQQHGKGRGLARAQQVGRHLGLRQAEREQDVEMIHAAIVGENLLRDVFCREDLSGFDVLRRR